ncbi:unnamed protein product [Adineta ricciae]|uniref:Uncharacterized protein n=2 Tax=Adineta ricciae TaxID=249248 RepID=A0A814W1S7_ADIRI|nr:unnamed protein product [Adineta ricciae]
MIIILTTTFLLNLCISVDTSYFIYHSTILQGSSRIYDCLYAHLVDSGKELGKVYLQNDHLIPYCRRPDENEEQGELRYPVLENIVQTYSFKQCKNGHITSEELLQWFSPIDIAENYERFINESDVFHNCSIPWFGSMCEYKFVFDEKLSFETIIDMTRAKQYEIERNISHGTCYQFLTNCSGRSWPLCLHWSDICDGKFDCLDGADEEFCDRLEMTKCNENEYRCHYGGQCIPRSFLKDNRFSIDCLDGSDEGEYVLLNTPLRISNCEFNSPFRCYEIIGRHPNFFQCDEGGYIQNNALPDSRIVCPNEKDKKVSIALLTNMEHILSIDCQKAFYCALHANRTFGFRGVDGSSVGINPILEDIRNEDCEPLSEHCESEWLVIPTVPKLFGFFQFVYFTNRSVDDFKISIEPDLVCFPAKACPVLLMETRPIQHINGLTCFSPVNFSFYKLTDFNDVFSAFAHYNYYCQTMGIDLSCENSTNFYCNESMKCISYNHVGDGHNDCYNREDEQFNTCNLNDSNRFQCLSDPTKCLLEVAMGDETKSCPDDEDELFAYTQDFSVLITYPYICNRDENILSYYYPLNETDETNCHWWPCNNTYTRCDKKLDCSNGIDELNCPYSNCFFNEFECHNEESGRSYCIPLSNMYDKYSNSCDTLPVERSVYFYNGTDDISEDYFSWNHSQCVSLEKLCRLNSSTTENICLYFSIDYFYWSIDYPTKLIPNDDNFCRHTFNPFRENTPRFLKTSRLGYLPSSPVNHSKPVLSQTNPTKRVLTGIDTESISYCHRGILALQGSNQTKTCFCPPNYFGSQCQWQNQRVSLTIQIVWRSVTFQMAIFELIIMLINEYGQIGSYHERITHMPARECNKKYNLYLLYPDRPKSLTQNYSIRIDIYEKTSLTYWASWHLPISFQFLPVNRIAAQITIHDLQNRDICTLPCGEHGKCMNYINEKSLSFCLCEQGYSGTYCNFKHECHCANDSFCLTSSICVCPLNRFGSHCYLKHSICQANSNNSCEHGGKCVPSDDRMALNGFTCFCPEDYSGKRCEIKNSRIDIVLNDEIRSATTLLLLHFITAFDHTDHERQILWKKFTPSQEILTNYITKPFHILFLEIPNPNSYYLAILREVFQPSEYIRTKIQREQRCLSIDQLNESLRHYEYFRRVKYYPLLCRQNLDLKCFYDPEHMCLCDQDRFANCFLFNHTINHDCSDYNYCENQGRCLRNNATCPSKWTCICQDCFYGNKCQFSTSGFILSLDTILAYHIQPKVSIGRQSLLIKISIFISSTLFLVGFCNGLLAFVTFRRSKVKRVGSGYYLLSSSIVSILTIILLTYKFWFLLLSQTSFIINRTLLHWNCLIVDVLIRIFLGLSEWLNCCVAIERMFSVIMGVRFRRTTSVRYSKRIIIIIIILVTSTHVHEPLRRELIDDFDIDERRIWCFVRYSSLIEKYNSVITLFHFLIPFIINIISSLWIIIKLAYRRRGVQRGETLKDHLRYQIQQHRHILYSPFILILLTLPRLIISFMRTCMRSTQKPWLLLIGYFLSFVPSMSIFIVFVLPSKIYKAELDAVVKQLLKKFRTVQ